jgi:hypothetical protein
MKIFIEIYIIATIIVAVSMFLGLSENAGLFGAICGVGFYAARKKG